MTTPASSPVRSSALPELWLRHSKALLVWALALCLLGVWRFFHLPFDWVPTLRLPEVTVSAVWPGASVEAVEGQVTAVLEEALQQVPGIAGLETSTREGEVLLRLQLSRGRDPRRITAELSDRIASLRGALPRGVEVDLAREIPEALREQQGLMTLEVVGHWPPDHLRELAQRVVRPRLLRLPGLSRVTVEGGEERELRLTLARDRLQKYGISSEEVRSRLQEALAAADYGFLRGQGGIRMLRRLPEPELAALRLLPVKPIRRPPGVEASVRETKRRPTAPFSGGLRLEDLGHLELAPAPVESLRRIDGQPVVTLRVDRAPDSHLLATAGRVRALLDAWASGAARPEELPPGIQVRVADDYSEGVRRQLRELALATGLGALAVLLLLALLLGNLRAVAALTFSVLVALAGAIVLLEPLGISLNLLTLAGLGLLLGLLIDNAVVVTESLQSALGQGGRPGVDRAASRVLAAVGLPLLGGTLSTAAVFLPMVYLSGDLRGLFAPFAALAALTLGLSLASSLVLIPACGHHLPLAPTRRFHTRLRRRLARSLLAPYRVAGRYPKSTLLLLALAVGLPTPLLPDRCEEPPQGWQSPEERRQAEIYNRTLGSDAFRTARLRLDPLLGGVTRPFLEQVELGRRWEFDARPEVRIWLRLPPGSGVARTDECLRPFEEEALRSPAVRRTLVQVWGTAGLLQILFHDAAVDSPEPYRLRERLIGQATRIAGMEVAISGLVPTGYYSGLGNVLGFDLHAYGPGYERLEELSRLFARRLRRHPRVAEVDVHAAAGRRPPGREVIRLHWGSEAVARTSLRPGDLTDRLTPLLWRDLPDFYAELPDHSRLPVRLVQEGAEELDLGTLLATPLDAAFALSAEGRRSTVRLSDHAEVRLVREPPVIERLDQQYRRTLRVYYRGPYRRGQELLDREIASASLPSGYRLELARQEFFTTEVRGEFLWLLLGTVGLVYLVLAAVLESWRLPAVLLLSLPLAWIGVALAFLLSGEGFAEGAFLGSVLTVGIAVNDSLLLTDAFRRLRRARAAGPSRLLALLALRRRLRPMWTTTLTTIAGLLPLLLLSDRGNFWVGLALTVVGGLVASTLLTPAAAVALLGRWKAK